MKKQLRFFIESTIFVAILFTMLLSGMYVIFMVFALGYPFTDRDLVPCLIAFVVSLVIYLAWGHRWSKRTD